MIDFKIHGFVFFQSILKIRIVKVILFTNRPNRVQTIIPVDLDFNFNRFRETFVSNNPKLRSIQVLYHTQTKYANLIHITTRFFKIQYFAFTVKHSKSIPDPFRLSKSNNYRDFNQSNGIIYQTHSTLTINFQFVLWATQHTDIRLWKSIDSIPSFSWLRIDQLLH